MASQNNSSEPVPLPPDRYESYMYSKRDTNEVLDWLRTNASRKAKDYPFDARLTLKDIHYAAKLVIARKVKIPLDIQDAFKRLLRGRRKLTEWFRQVEQAQGKAQSAATDAHKAFNDTLSQVYHMMFSEEEKICGNRQSDPQPFTSTKEPSWSDNIYDVLANIVEDEDESLDDESDTQARRLLENNHDDSNDQKSDYIIEDDPLRDQCEAMSWLLELDIGCSLVKQWFEKVRDNKMSIVVAATLTSTLVNHFMMRDQVHNIGKQIGSCGEVLNLLFERQKQDAKAGDCSGSASGGHQDEGQSDQEGAPCYKFRKGISLIIFSRALRDFIRRKDEPGFLNNVDQKPIHSYFLTPVEDAERERACSLGAACNKLDYEGCISIFKILWNNHSKGSETDCMLPQSSFVDFVGNYQPCGVPNCTCNQMQTSFAWYVQVILESAKSFIWKDGKPNPVNCRIQTLRLGQEILSSMEKLQEVTTKTPLAIGLYMRCQNQALMDLSQRTLRTPLFDLLHQSPFISGRKSNELLQHALLTSMPLLDQMGIFGTVLYLYKVCQSATGSEHQIPVLDNLCAIFRESVFMGEFPTKNFELVYTRFLKIPRKTAKDHRIRKEGRTRHDFDWDKTYWMGDGYQNRIQQAAISPWFDLMQRDEKLDGEFWARLAGVDKNKRLSRGTILQIERLMRTEPLAKTFSHLEEALSRDFEEGFKIPRINFFKVFPLAVRTLHNIGKSTMGLILELRDTMPIPSVEEALLDSIDEEDYRADNGNGHVLYGIVEARKLFEELDNTPNRRKHKDLRFLQLIQREIEDQWRTLSMEALYWKAI